MWYGDKKPIVHVDDQYLFEIFFESPKGNKILYLSKLFIDNKPREVLPEYSWSEIDQIYTDYLTFYSRFRGHYTFYWEFESTINLENFNILKPDDVQFQFFSEYEHLNRGFL